MNPPSIARSAASPTRIARLALLIVAIALLAACAGAPRRSGIAPSALANEPARGPDGEIAAANDVLFRAMALVGTPYHWGGNTPAGGFDCSGLVDYIYRNATGLQLPRTSGEMADMGVRKVKRMTQLVSGDLVFFDIGGHISHVGVYVGKGRFVHAPNSGGTVRLDDIDGRYWAEHFAFGRRVLD
ncbi:C40 family peptidase [Rhodanobacter sp. Si-c]|uniref:C40 family peptidase n=1 Tax=Rhodanobacter lycopersici TaxID=3162487 RepID=A0ABV3QGV5_9GAMM